MIIDYDKEFPTKPIIWNKHNQGEGQIDKIFLDLHIHHLILRTQSINKNHLKIKSMNVSGFWGEFRGIPATLRWDDEISWPVLHPRISSSKWANLGKKNHKSGHLEGIPLQSAPFLGWPTNRSRRVKGRIFFCPGKRHDRIPKIVFLGLFWENPSILNYLLG